MKIFIYIEINNASLTLSIIKQKNYSYIIQKINIIKLNNLEFKDGIIYNPSKILFYIQDFLTINKLKNIKTIISMPNIKINQEIIEKLMILQHALCICKAGLKIEKIINTSIINNDSNIKSFNSKIINNQKNLYSFLLNKNKHPFCWIFTSLILSILMLYIAQVFNIKQNNQISLLKMKTQNLSQINLNFKKELDSLNTIKVQNDEIENKIKKIQQIKNIPNNISNLLVHTAYSIPKDSFLTKLSILKNPNSEKTKQQSKTSLQLQGITKNQKSILQLCNKLKDLKIIQSVKPNNFKRIKTKKTAKNNQLKEFEFQITALIKNNQ
ncbi:hypothetical protein GF322_01515 [Candidatus Dependentiae bacterium]|nr:hypothetical protein [Candidatus Dependentiae bacterium]